MKKNFYFLNMVQKVSCVTFELTKFQEQIMRQYKILSWLSMWQKQRHSLIQAFSWFLGFYILVYRNNTDLQLFSLRRTLKIIKKMPCIVFEQINISKNITCKDTFVNRIHLPAAFEIILIIT